MAALESPIQRAGQWPAFPRDPIAAAPRRPAAPERPRPAAMGFARTKIQPPRPRVAAQAERPRLETRLAQALLTQRLVLISAAAGYGKTTLLARQIERLPAGTALAWISADEGDDLQRLLACLIAAIEPLDPPWRTAPEALVAQAGDPHTRSRVVAEVLNALDACEVAHGVIVIDDLHRIYDGPLLEFLDRLLDRMSARWTLALATRHDPPLALARLRALGELAEFRQADLQLDRDTVLAMAKEVGLGAAQAEALYERTQGWAAGLRLGLSRSAGQAPVASDRAMFDFLAAEVIDQLEPGLRGFLLRTSVLPELTAARAAAVSGDARAALRMEQIDRLGLFVTTLDAAEPTLKLHDLFREALEQRLQRELPDEWPRLWQRAALGESDPTRKLVMMLRAGDLEAAAETAHALVPALLTDGALAGVARLVDQFPGSFVAASPVMQTVLGMMAWARWDFTAMAEAMRRAEAGHAARGDEDRLRAAVAYQSLALNALGRNAESQARLAPLRREAVATETRVVVLVASLWHALDLGSNHRVGPLLDELMDLLERTDDASLWYRGHPLPRINGLPGTARSLQRYVQGALRLAGERPMPLRALAHAQNGWHLAWQEGDLDAAETALSVALDDTRWAGDPPNVKGSLQLLATFLHALRGNRACALATAQTLVDEHLRGRGPWSLWANVYYAARIAALFEEREMLERNLTRLEQSAGGVAAPTTQMNQLEPLRGQRAWLAGDREAAIAHWQHALENEASIDRLGHGIETRLFLATALLDGGRAAEAAAALAPVPARVAAGAGIGAVLIARPALCRLTDADWRGSIDLALLQHLRRWQALAQGGSTTAAPPQALQLGGLSARELEVAARIAAGDSNKLIARAFDLSPHTVKRHVANVLDKLGLQSRGQVAAWYLAQH